MTRLLLPAALVLCAALSACDGGGMPQGQRQAEAGVLATAPAAPTQTSTGNTVLPTAPAQADEFADIKSDEQATITLPPAGQVVWDWARPGEKVAPLARLAVLDGKKTDVNTLNALRDAGVYTVCLVEASRPHAANLAGVFNLCQYKGFSAVVVRGLFADGTWTPAQATAAADLAHQTGLAIFQNGGEQFAARQDGSGRVVADVFDGLLTQNCGQRGACSDLLPYFQRGKQVLNTEKKGTMTARQKNQLERLGISTRWQ